MIARTWKGAVRRGDGDAYEGAFTLGDETCEVGAGELVVVPAGVPHGFKNTGDGPLKQVDIHVSPSFQTDWLD
jgi:mannose-6-phosphate isomerase-like protein (cupin superfamily)